jgi:hypothetical protein
MAVWYSSVYNGLIFSSIVSFLLAYFTEKEVSLLAYIIGYSLLSLAIMMILIILISNLKTDGLTTLQTLYNILLTCGPFILMLFVIVFIIYLMGSYSKIIIDQHISNNYYSFSNILISLLLLQIYVVYTNISTEKFEKTGKISKVTSSIICLLGILTFICSVIIFTILKYFTTDGFTADLLTTNSIITN